MIDWYTPVRGKNILEPSNTLLLVLIVNGSEFHNIGTLNVHELF